MYLNTNNITIAFAEYDLKDEDDPNMDLALTRQVPVEVKCHNFPQ